MRGSDKMILKKKGIEVAQTYDNIHESDAEEPTTEDAAIQTKNAIMMMTKMTSLRIS